jgi:hydrogenase maturation factor
VAMDVMAEDLGVQVPTLLTAVTEDVGMRQTTATAGIGTSPPDVTTTLAKLSSSVTMAPTCGGNRILAAAADATRRMLASGQQPRAIRSLQDALQELKEQNDQLRG